MYRRVLAALLLLSVSAAESPSRIVNTAQGPVKGYKDEEHGYYTFKNIPYATTPTGADKFKAPLPPPTWKEPFEAVDEGVICPQTQLIFSLYPEGRVVREDCLIANVYVPEVEENELPLPVMVSVHGGGFFVGYGDWVVPKELIKESKVILVNFNYRLGAHGFLSLGTPDIPGNGGMKDQLALLRWVNENIHNFGGNPDDVTIQGGSAGSAAVDLLMLAKPAEGLFSKVIPESGASIGAFTIQSDPLENAKTYAKFLNFTNVDDIHALEDFYKTVSFELLQLDPFFTKKDSAFLFSPCVEKPGKGAFLDKSPVDILKSGNYKKVPLLYGFANMEGLIRIEQFDQWKEAMNENLSDFLPADLKFSSDEKRERVVKRIKRFYFDDEPVSENNIVSYVNFFTDVMFAYPSLRTVKYHLEAGHRQIYLYHYTFVDKNTPNVPHTKVKGADHCAQSMALIGGIPWKPELSKSDAFKKSAALIRYLWGHFIKTGEPVPQQGTPLPWWPPVTKPWGAHMEIGTNLILKGSLLNDRMVFWDKIYNDYYRDPVPADTYPNLRNEL